MRQLISLLSLLAIVSSTNADTGADSELAGIWVTQTPFSEVAPNYLVFERAADVWTGYMTTDFGKIELHDIDVAEQNVSFHQFMNVGITPHEVPILVRGGLSDGKLHLYFPSGTAVKERVARKASDQELGKLEAMTPPSQVLEPFTDEGFVKTPPMGWSSWNHFANKIDDKTVREIADAMVASGLRDVGYEYVNIDDGWQGTRDAQGRLQPNEKFPDMRALGKYIHERGLKFGIYSGPGPQTCGQYPGSYGHEAQDAQMFADWGVDYLKYDWCSADQVYNTPAEMQAAYHKMGMALRDTQRPIVYALCQYGLYDVDRWGRQVGAQVWRTTFDILDTWPSMAGIGFGQLRVGTPGGPGGWRDPDMLQVGNGGLSVEECRTHLTLWSMLSAPLLLGNDVRQMSPEIKALITNREVIAIDQDPLGRPPRPVYQQGAVEIWSKPLANGDTAIAFFNRGATSRTIPINWAEWGFPGQLRVRDLWKQEEVDLPNEVRQIDVLRHGTVLWRVTPPQDLNIVCVGDSITEWADPQPPPTLLQQALRKRRFLGKVTVSNQGHSGYTTVNFLPSQGGTLAVVEEAAIRLEASNEAALLVFSVMLGTNDSAEEGPLGSPMTPAQYVENMTTIIDQLLSKFPGCLVIIHRPLWYSPNTQNNARYLAAGLARLESYFPAIDQIVAHHAKSHPQQVFRGDTAAFDYFEQNHEACMVPEEGRQGTFYLHPNEKGAQALAEFWERAIYQILEQR